MKKSEGKDLLVKKDAKGKLALEELTSDEEDGYGYYHQSTDIPVEEKQDHDQDDDGEQSDEDSQDEIIKDYQMRAKQRKEALLRE